MRRVSDWLAETHSSGFELRRHFFSRFFESEFISSPGQAKVVAGGAAAVVFSVGILFIQAYYHKYLLLGNLDDPEPFLRAEIADALFLITLAMLAMGTLATLVWPALFPGLRDYLALAALPLRMRDVFVAKFSSLFAFAALATIAMTYLPSGILPAVMAGGWDPNPARQFPAILISSFLACMFVFLSLVLVQGLLLNLVPVRHFSRVSLSVQGILLTAFLCAFPFAFWIPNLQDRIDMDMAPAWAAWAPPLWFLGLDQVIDGNIGPLASRLARSALAGTAATAAGAILTYLWSYHRHRKRVVESPGLVTNGRLQIPPLFSDCLLSNPRTLAVFDFTAKSLARSRHHRLILTGFCALALAVIVQGISGSETVVAAPLALSLFALTGLRYLFRHPIELRANWLFRIHQPGNAAPLLAGAERFLLYCGVLPIAVSTLPAEISLLGAREGLLASIACALLSLTLMEVLLFSFEKIPFTSSYFPGRRPLIETVLRYTIIVAFWIGGLSSLIRLSLKSSPAIAALIALLLAAWWKARKARLNWQRTGLEFEEVEDPAVQVLDIDRD